MALDGTSSMQVSAAISVRNAREKLDEMRGRNYYGRIKSNAVNCWASFPGKFLVAWDTLTGFQHGDSVASVFLNDPDDGLGCHHFPDPENPERCYCSDIFGERDYKTLGYLMQVKKDCTRKEKVKMEKRAKAMKAHLVVGEASEEDVEEAKQRWEDNKRRAAWGCKGFHLRLQNVEKAVQRGQRLKVVYFPGQKGQGKVPWEELPTADLWDGVGCGGSQKAEIAILDKMGWPYDEVDVLDFLALHFRVGQIVQAWDINHDTFCRAKIREVADGEIGWQVVNQETQECFHTSYVRRLQAAAAMQYEASVWKEFSLDRYKEAREHLPVVSICFVGRGRAGKTTTLRRLKGERLQEHEPSTIGVDTWAGQTETYLKMGSKESNRSGPWKSWKDEMHVSAFKDILQDKANEALPGAKRQRGGVDVRLQCWDFPGQEEYALLTQLYFSEMAIYLVFFDLTGAMNEEWRHISFWLWAIARFSAAKSVQPPIFLLGTHAGAASDDKLDESELQHRLRDLQTKIPSLAGQLQPRPANFVQSSTCDWLFLVENSDETDAIRPLRCHLQETALQLVTPAEKWTGDDKPRFLGLQAAKFPLPWLQAHDLLSKLGAGFRAKAQRTSVQKAATDAKPGPWYEIQESPSPGSELMVPKGAFIKLVKPIDVSQEEVDLEIACDFLHLSSVKELLACMQPVGLAPEETENVLTELDKLGVLIWINEADSPSLRDLVMLNPRRLAVAMAKLMIVCFGPNNFEHADDSKYCNLQATYENVKKNNFSDLLRFQSTGIATEALIKEIWHKDLPDPGKQELTQQILIRKGLMCERNVQSEFLLPSCLPIAHCLEEAFRTSDNDEVLYLDFGGLLSPNLFPNLAHVMRQKNQTHEDEFKCEPGPPLVFRNRGEFLLEDHSVFTSMIPVDRSGNSKSLLRILVKGVRDTKTSSSEVAKNVKKIFIEKVMGFDPNCDLQQDDLDSFFKAAGISNKEAFEGGFVNAPCMDYSCKQQCSLCKVHELLKERFLPDLSEGLRAIVRQVAFFRTHTRPAGSFRFKAVEFPRDIDLEEYLVINAESREKALISFREQIQKRFGNFSVPDVLDLEGARVKIFFKGLKAGCKSNLEWLNWTAEDLLQGKKDEEGRRFSLTQALEKGHFTWTTKIDMFAKVRLLGDRDETPRFFKISNVLRAGWFKDSHPIQPITKEKDFLQAIAKELDKCSGEEPNALKYVKRLWERSAYLAQRGFDLDWHLTILEALKPLLRSWAAELGQIAGHIETLRNMMTFGLPKDACSDFPILCQNLSRMLSRLQRENDEDDDSDKQAAQEGIDCIQRAMKHIPEEQQVLGKEKEKLLETDLHKAQLLLESCVETVIINKLGSLEFPKVAEKLGTLWQFPSDHPPIGAELALGKCDPIRAASWNVLNRHYYKYIEKDWQGLKGSQITTSHEAEKAEETREIKIVEKIKEMLLQKEIHILCLQECWPELLQQLKGALDALGKFEMHCSGQKDDKNQEAIIYDSKLLQKPSARPHLAFTDKSKVVTEIQFEVAGGERLRVVTAHVPGTPFGNARREFADCLTAIVKGETLPTVLLADLNFPEKAIRPFLLLDSGNNGNRKGLDIGDVHFVPTPYPTNICQFSLLPKRIDSIAVINAKEGVQLQAEALPPEDVLEGLAEVVELLKSRSAKPLLPYRYQPDKPGNDPFKRGKRCHSECPVPKPSAAAGGRRRGGSVPSVLGDQRPDLPGLLQGQEEDTLSSSIDAPQASESKRCTL